MTSPGPGFELGTDGPSLILVGVDGSRTSLRAAAYAAGLARRQHSRLLVVYVMRPVTLRDEGVITITPGWGSFVSDGRS